MKKVKGVRASARRRQKAFTVNDTFYRQLFCGRKCLKVIFGVVCSVCVCARILANIAEAENSKNKTMEIRLKGVFVIMNLLVNVANL